MPTRRRKSVSPRPIPPPKPTDALVRRTLAELAAFTDYCALYGATGYVGEFGVPNNAGSEQASWNNLLDNYYLALRNANHYGTQWSSGEGWGTYILALHSNLNSGDPINRAVSASEATLAAQYMSARIGVGVAGWEFGAAAFGANRDPARYFTTTQLASWNYLSANNVQLARLAMMWERVQPTLNAALDTTRLTELGQMLADAKAKGIKIILDLHNYGRYSPVGNTSETSGGVPLTSATASNLADFWTRMGTFVRGHAAGDFVLGYGIMNEPHDLNPEPGTFANNTTRYDFTNGRAGWNYEGSGAAMVASATLAPDGKPTLAVTGTYTGNYTGYRLREGANTARNWSANGLTLRASVYLPAGTVGNFAFNWAFYNAAFADQNPTQGGVPLVAGQWTDVQGTFTAAQLAAVQDLVPTIYAGGGNGTSVTALMGTVQQGSISGGKTASQVWEGIANTTANAIRVDDARPIMVSGYRYGDIKTFATNHPVPFVSATNIVYEAHHYWNATSGNDGVYTASYATELAQAVTDGY